MSEELIVQTSGSPLGKTSRLPVFLLATLTVLTLANTVALWMLYARVAKGVPVVLAEDPTGLPEVLEEEGHFEEEAPAAPETEIPSPTSISPNQT